MVIPVVPSPHPASQCPPAPVGAPRTPTPGVQWHNGTGGGPDPIAGMTHGGLLCCVRWGFTPPPPSPPLRGPPDPISPEFLPGFKIPKGNRSPGLQKTGRKSGVLVQSAQPRAAHLGGTHRNGADVPRSAPRPEGSDGSAIHDPFTRSLPGVSRSSSAPAAGNGGGGGGKGGVRSPGEGRRAKGRPWNLSREEVGSTRGAVRRGGRVRGGCVLDGSHGFQTGRTAVRARGCLQGKSCGFTSG